MNQLWKTFQSIGIGEGTPAGEAQRVVLLNRLCLVVILITAILLAPFFQDHKFWGAMISAVCLLAACLSLYLTHRRQYAIARWNIVVLISGLISLTFAKSGSGGGIEISYFSICIGIMMLFPDWKSRLLLIGLNVGGYLLTILLGPGWFASPFSSPTTQYAFNLIFLGNLLFVILALESMLSYHREIEGNMAKVNRQLSSQNEDLEMFNHALSHHLKTAVRSIVGYLDLADRTAPPVESPERNQYVNMARSSARNLQYMVTDLMTLVGLREVEKRPHWFGLEECMRDVLMNIAPLLTQQNAQVIVQELPEIFAHPVHLQLLLHNLIHNGVKYNDKEMPEVIVSAYVRGEGILLCIADNGIGISEGLQEKIFAPFARLHAVDEYEGNGLGLAICQKVVDYYQGHIQVSSQLGMGTKFEIWLKLPVRVGTAGSHAMLTSEKATIACMELGSTSQIEDRGIS